MLSRNGKENSILRSKSSISMPALSDDRQYIAYISNERGEADLFLQNLHSARRVTAIRSVVNPLEVSFSKNKMEVILVSGEKK